MSMADYGPLIAQGVGALAGGIMGKNSAESTPTHLQSGGSNFSTTTPHPSMLPNLGMMAGGSQIMGQTPTPFFPGQTYVSPSAPTQAGVNSGMNAAQNMMPGVLDMAGGNYGFLSGAADVANNPYVQAMNDMTQKNMTQNLMENILPNVNAGAMSVNAMGSGRHGLMQGRAIEGTSQSIADAMTQTNLGAYGQGLDAQQNALSQTGNMLSNLMAPSQAMVNIGQGVEGYQGAALQDSIDRFNYQYTEPWGRMNNMAGMVSNFQPYGQTYGNNTSTNPNINYMTPNQGMVSGAMMGSGAAKGIYDGITNLSSNPSLPTTSGSSPLGQNPISS